MSCGRPHATPCDEVLDRLYEFLDTELETASAAEIQQHLDECAPCLAQLVFEQAMKARVAQSCACDPAPEHVRQRVVTWFSEVRVTYRYETE